MTKEEKEMMMSEIMEVVERLVAKSEKKEALNSSNKYGREYDISDEVMAKWKEEYRKIRVDTKTVLEEVRRRPIDATKLEASFDLDSQIELLK